MNFGGGVSNVIFAQANPAAQISYARWVFRTLGIGGAIVCLLGLAIFIGACVVVAKRRRAPLMAAYLLLAPLPLALAVLQVVKGTAISFAAASMSGVLLTQANVLDGLSESLLVILAGSWASLPTYLVISGGLLLCAFRAGQPTPA